MDGQINASSRTDGQTARKDRQTPRTDEQTTRVDGHFNAATSRPHSAAVLQVIARPEMPHVRTQLPLASSAPPVLAYPDAPHILTRPLFIPSIPPSMSGCLGPAHALTGPALISPHVSQVPIHPTCPKFTGFIDPALYYQFLQG